jgi:acyl-lipid omega-6 desaturase (Delta-12 desaturase)
MLSASPYESTDWLRALARFEVANPRRAARQLANTLVPYAALLAAMVWLLQRGYSYALVLPLAVIAGGLLVRVFIFFHDCCHQSFLPTRRANRVLGYLLGVLVMTPFDDWRRPHALHHASAGDRDRRGFGDVWTLTVSEYRALPLKNRILYRLYRNPFIMLLLGPSYMFLLGNRFPHSCAGRREHFSVAFTNLSLLGLLVLANFTIGLKLYLLVQIPCIVVAGTAGVWMFYVQHQFEDVYWEEHAAWSHVRAALEGSSYYRLPQVLQWFTGNIGLHHVHHLRPRIPNYNLQPCHEATPFLQNVRHLGIRESFGCLRLNLYDEHTRKMVSFSALRQRP